MNQPILMPFQDLPFNGDTFIQSDFLALKTKFGLNCAIETGSCLFSTTVWLAQNFKTVYTVEKNLNTFGRGLEKIGAMTNIHAAIMDSADYLRIIKPQIYRERNIFFLDAHWENECPLLRELDAIKNMNLVHKPVIAIHDFQVPDSPLGFDCYNEQPLNLEYVKSIMDDIYDCKYDVKYNTVDTATEIQRGIAYFHSSQ